MISNWKSLDEAIAEKKALDLESQPTELRRCLRCNHWFHAVLADKSHRLCVQCKNPQHHYKHRGRVGRRVD